MEVSGQLHVPVALLSVPTRDQVDPRVGVDAVKKRKSFAPIRNQMLTPGSACTPPLYSPSYPTFWLDNGE
jgi:hypothetical protein